MRPVHYTRIRTTRQSLRQSRHGFHDVVVDHDHREQHQEDERSLVDPLLDPDADVAPQNPFDDQHQDHAAIQNRNRQQVEDAKVQADHCHQASSGVQPGWLAASPEARAMPMGPSICLMEVLCCDHLAHQIHDQQRILFVLIDATGPAPAQTAAGRLCTGSDWKPRR